MHCGKLYDFDHEKCFPKQKTGISCMVGYKKKTITLVWYMKVRNVYGC